MVYFFVFALIGFFFTYFRNILLHRENENILGGVFNMFLWMDMDHIKNYGFVLWFLPALFWGKFINFILLKYLKNKLLIGCLIFSIFYLIISTKIKLPFVTDLGMISALWIYIGYIIYNFYKEKILNYWPYYIFILPLILVLLPIPDLNLSIRYFSSPLYNIFYSLLIIVFLFVSFNKLNWQGKINKHLQFIGQNTMFLFVFHPYTNNIIYLISNKYFGNLWYINFILSFGLIYVILLIVRKYFNKGILKYV